MALIEGLSYIARVYLRLPIPPMSRRDRAVCDAADRLAEAEAEYEVFEVPPPPPSPPFPWRQPWGMEPNEKTGRCPNQGQMCNCTGACLRPLTAPATPPVGVGPAVAATAAGHPNPTSGHYCTPTVLGFVECACGARFPGFDAYKTHFDNTQ